MYDEPAPSIGSTRRSVSRRAFIGGGFATAVVLGGGGTAYLLRSRPTAISATSAAVGAAERARPSTGNVVRKTLVARPTEIDLGGRVVKTLAYGDSVHGPLIRANTGDTLEVRLRNDLPIDTTVHWHGLALRNDMDGVPGLTMPPVKPGAEFVYSFKVPDPGTYWYHPHVGAQLDTGLYGPLIVDDPNERGDYDVEAVLVLDDWTDGWGKSPSAILADFRRNGMGSMGSMGSMGGMGGMGTTPDEPLGADTGDVAYPGHLINGRLPADPDTVRARPGQRVRLRLINAGGDTAYRFAVAGHALTVTHADGFATKPVTVDALVIGMGERYDVEVTANDGVFAIAAVPEGKKNDPGALAVLRTSSGAVSTDPKTVPQLGGRLLTYADLSPRDEVRLPSRSVDRSMDLTLQSGKGGRRWLLNGRTFAEHEPLEVRQGERVRISMTNRSMMFHPMHLHGHTFALKGSGLRKDTVNVLPMGRQSIEFQADNPGQWMIHCHNIYHAELGMMGVTSYVE
jgi:FtsP/CotA-like multicopper oxidase with cupredoxin domain